MAVSMIASGPLDVVVGTDIVAGVKDLGGSIPVKKLPPPHVANPAFNFLIWLGIAIRGRYGSPS